MRDALSRLEPAAALRRAVRYMLGKLCSATRPNWPMRLMLHEMTQPTPAFARVVDEVIAPNSIMLRGIVGRLIALPPDHETSRLCTHSIIGQVLHYAQSRPVILRLWPELDMTEENLDRIANHIADFSLAYLKQQRKANLKNRNNAS
jgi:hypothetical protein